MPRLWATLGTMQQEDIKVDEEEYGDFFMFEADSEEEAWTDPVHGDSFSNCFVPVWHFRRAMFNDFQARMDWCVKSYGQANHNPMAAFNGDKTDTIVHLEAAPSEKVRLDASASSDPDKDGLAINWWVYQEAGTYKSDIVIPDHTASVTTLTVPDDALGSEIHVILEVQDDSQIVSLYDYRRIVITIE